MSKLRNAENKLFKMSKIKKLFSSALASFSENDNINFGKMWGRSKLRYEYLDG